MRLPERLRRPWLALGWGWVVALAWASLTPAPPDPGLDLPGVDKLYHCAAYAFLMAWFALAARRRPPLAAALALMGVGLEILQGLGGVRWFEWWDMAANATGVVLGWGAMVLAGRLSARPVRAG